MVTDADSIIAASAQSLDLRARAKRRVRSIVSKLRFLGLSPDAARSAAGGIGGGRSRRVTQTVSRPSTISPPTGTGYLKTVDRISIAGGFGFWFVLVGVVDYV